MRLASLFMFLAKPTRDDIERRSRKKVRQGVEFSCACRLSRSGGVDLCAFHAGMEAGYDAAVRDRS